MHSPLVCAQHLEMLSEGKGCHGRNRKGRMFAQGHFTGSETETHGCELKPHKPLIKQGSNPGKMSTEIFPAHRSVPKNHFSLHTALRISVAEPDPKQLPAPMAAESGSPVLGAGKDAAKAQRARTEERNGRCSILPKAEDN